LVKKEIDTKARKEEKTSWGGVSEWYSEYLETTPDSYQAKVILPNLLRILDIKQGLRVLDIACGQGYFTRAIAAAGARAMGADISGVLVGEARRLSSKEISFHIAPAHELGFAEDTSFDAATVVLAVQNIENIAEAFAEAARVLVPHGRLVLVLMHPAFRVPKASSWGWDARPWVCSIAG
jgi:ubiquinone/menaquinone biosynthesis C-methylase UbiE